MVKAKVRGLKNKKSVLIISLIGLAALGVAGYYGYAAYQAGMTQQKAVINEAQKEAKDLNIAGDDDLATQYIAALKAKQTAKAQKLFTDKVAAEPDTQKKIDLYVQNIQLALSYQHPDQAVEAGLRAVEIRQTHDVYAQVAAAYVGKNDYANQAIYLQKALDAAKSSNGADRDMYVRIYEEQLASVTEILKAEQR